MEIILQIFITKKNIFNILKNLNKMLSIINTLHAEPVYVNWASSAEFNRVRARARLIDSQNEPLPQIFLQNYARHLSDARRCQRNFREPSVKQVFNILKSQKKICHFLSFFLHYECFLKDIY